MSASTASLHIKIEGYDNAALNEDPTNETARILEELAAKIRSRGLQGVPTKLYDVNGNRAGDVTLYEGDLFDDDEDEDEDEGDDA
jgi:hypothetical protein